MKRLNLLCLLGHRWFVQADPETHYSKAGILCGSVDVGTRGCTRCGKVEDVWRAGGLFAATRWKPYPNDPRVREAVYDGHLPMQKLTAWRRAKDEKKHAEMMGSPCPQCTDRLADAEREGKPCKSKRYAKIGTLREHRSDHEYHWWVGYRCDICTYSRMSYRENKKLAAK